MGLNVHSNLLRLIRAGGMWGDGYLCPKTYSLYSLHCHHQIDCIKAGSCVRRYNVTLIMWAKSQDTVHKPHFFKRKESWSRSNQGPSAYQHSTLPLGHTGSWLRSAVCWYYQWEGIRPCRRVHVGTSFLIVLDLVCQREGRGSVDVLSANSSTISWLCDQQVGFRPCRRLLGELVSLFTKGRE